MKRLYYIIYLNIVNVRSKYYKDLFNFILQLYHYIIIISYNFNYNQLDNYLEIKLCV